MFWLRNKKKIQLHTFIWGPAFVYTIDPDQLADLDPHFFIYIDNEIALLD